jgi:hypothetical protein
MKTLKLAKCSTAKSEISFRGFGHELKHGSINARKEIERLSHAIENEFLRRLARQKLDGLVTLASENGFYFEAPNDWFKRHAYRLIRLVLKYGRAQIFEEIILSGDRHKSGVPAICDHPFKLGLFAIIKNTTTLTPVVRRNYADQMLYAYRHGVPSKYLNAFIAKAGSAELTRKKLDKPNIREPGFKHSSAN